MEPKPNLSNRNQIGVIKIGFMEPKLDLFYPKLDFKMFIFRTKNLKMISQTISQDFFIQSLESMYLGGFLVSYRSHEEENCTKFFQA